MSTEAPRRRHQLTLDLQADSLPDLAYELHMIADGLEVREPRDDVEKVNRTSGGVHAGYHLELSTDYDQTHSRYMSEINAWLKAKRDARRLEAGS